MKDVFIYHGSGKSDCEWAGWIESVLLQWDKTTYCWQYCTRCSYRFLPDGPGFQFNGSQDRENGNGTMVIAQEKMNDNTGSS